MAWLVTQSGMITIAAIAATPTAFGSLPDSLLRAVPKDAAAVCFVAGPDAAADAVRAPSSLDFASYLVERAQGFGLLSTLNERTRTWLDVLASISELWDYPHAAVLLDIQARARPDGGHELSHLHAALIIHTNGGGAGIEQRIQHLLNSYTNDENSTLNRRERDGAPVFALRDRRLPDWVALTWGPRGDHYVIAIGEGSFDRIAQAMMDRSESLAADEWFAKAWEAAGGERAFLAGLVRFDALHAAASDDSLRSKFQRVEENLRLSGVDRALLTVGRQGRAIEAGAFFHRDDRDEWQPLTRSDADGLIPGVIPDEATWYSILNVDPPAFLDTVSKAYLASRSADAQEKSRKFWLAVEEKVGLSIERDIAAHLQPPVVSHNYPPHALGLPFAWTRLIAVAEPEALRRNLDRVLEAAREALAEDGPTKLHRDADGVWYLSFGIAGPALTIADHWLIVSFSPEAVRKNVQMLSRRSASAAPPGQK